MKSNIYENVIDQKKFRSTNQLWNQLKLNHPMSVGYVTTLIESRSFSNKEEWRDFYFASGEERLEKARKENIDLTNFNSPQTKNLQLNYGRTLNELRQKGRILYNAIEKKGNPLGITLAECIYIVKYRVIGETWNGIVMRERNTVETLQKQFPQLTFQKVDGANDFKYAIDYEIYLKNKLLGAIQIKPISYLKGKSPSILTAKEANLIKNNSYTNITGKPVLYVYSNNKGEILESDVLLTLHELIQKELKIA